MSAFTRPFLLRLAAGLAAATMLFPVAAGADTRDARPGPNRAVSERRGGGGGGESEDEAERCDERDDSGGRSYCAGEVIVRLEPGVTVDDLSGKFKPQEKDRIDGRSIFLITARLDKEEEDLADLRRENGVVWAELNFVGNAPQGNPSRFFPRGVDANAPVAIQSLKGSAGAGRSQIGADDVDCVDGRGVTVAVIDTGIDARHPMFRKRLTKPWNAFSARSGAKVVRDAGDRINNDGDQGSDGQGLVDEAVGHGTHIAGIVLQTAPQAHIMPIEALDSDGVGQAFYLARAIAHAIDGGADVINLSLGAEGDSTAVEEAVGEAVGAGVVVVAAAGNAGPGAQPEFPAASAGVIAVGAVDGDNRPAAFSSRYPEVDLSAPGVDIGSAFPRGAQGVRRHFASWSGTSMAAPWVAGAAALLLEADPSLSPGEVADRLVAAADPIAGVDGLEDGMGSGRLDVAGAVGCLD